MKPLQPAVLALGSAGISAGGAAAMGLISASLATALGGVALAGVVGAVALGSARPDLCWFGEAVCRAKHPGRLALTIDDGPDPVSTPPILEALAKANAHATFFLLGDRAERHAALARALADAGHEVALHGPAHDARFTVLPPARGAVQLLAAADRLSQLTGAPVRWFRPPFGAVSPRVYASASAAGLPIAWCSVRTGDGGFASPRSILARCAKAVGTDIVLLHDGPGYARSLLPEILEDWDRRGITASTLTSAMEPG
ncbi:MAG: polysaccharide deacetylase family protein [Myxococcales bacterium]|nr:polysaccharide deacetylase family protein [Myxococcales bacterium]